MIPIIKVPLVPCYTCGQLTENNGFEPICDECENQVFTDAHDAN